MKKIFITIPALYIFAFVSAQVPTQDPYPDAPLAAANINQYALYVDSVSNVNQKTQTFAATSNP